MKLNSNKYLEDKALWLRKTCFEMFVSANQGHPGSVFSQVEILISLFYDNVINFDNNNKSLKNRDKMIISKGHATMGIYPILSDLGYFKQEELKKFGTPDGLLKIFGNILIPGIDATSGSLGHGPGIGSGYCIADKLDKNDFKTFVLISEGEMYEGSVWESALFASHNNLDNLVVIVDRNHKIILGDTEDLLSLSPIDEKWKSFGFEVSNVNGHDFDELRDGFKIINNKNNMPKAIIANTTKGKGVSIMEGVPSWHYWQGMTKDQIEKTREELV